VIGSEGGEHGDHLQHRVAIAALQAVRHRLRGLLGGQRGRGSAMAAPASAAVVLGRHLGEDRDENDSLEAGSAYVEWRWSGVGWKRWRLLPFCSLLTPLLLRCECVPCLQSAVCVLCCGVV